MTKGFSFVLVFTIPEGRNVSTTEISMQQIVK